MRVGVAPGLADRLGAAWHGDRLERRQPLAVAVVGQQEFAAPERAVQAVAKAVQGHADHRSGIQGDAILRQAGGDMGMMVLHFRQVRHMPRGKIAPQFCGQILGMAIDRDDRRHVLEQSLIRLDRLCVVGEGLGVLQIAHVVRQDGLAVAQQAERALQFTTHRKNRRSSGEAIRQAPVGAGA